MEFCSGIAVFQASFSLAEKIAKDELRNYKKKQQNHRQVLETITLAIEEIIAGLEKPNSISQQMNWKFKLVTILFMNGFRTEFPNLWLDLEESFYSVTSALPQISKDLLYDIVETTQMTETLLQVSAMFPGPIHGLQIKTGLQFCGQEPITKEKEQMAAAFLHHLCMEENNILFLKGITKKKDIECFEKASPKMKGSEHDQEEENKGKAEPKIDKEMDNFLFCLFKTATVVLKETKETRILFQWLINLVNLFNGLLGGKVDLRKHFDFTSSYADCLSDITQLTQESIVTSHELKELKHLVWKLEHFTDVSTPCVSASLKWLPSSTVNAHLLDLLISVISKLQVKGITNLQDLKDKLMSQDSKSTGISDLEMEVFHKCYHLTLDEHTLKSKESEIETLKEFLRSEITTRDTGEENVTVTSKAKLDKAFFYVEERMPGYRDAMQWIIEANNDLVKDHSWLICMENNTDLLQSKSSIMLLISRLQNWNGEENLDATYKTRLEKIILKVLCQLPVVVQNDILEAAGRTPDIFETQDSLFHTQLVSAFNRLVSNEKVVGEIAAIALKSGHKTVAKICEESISNQKQGPILVQLLASLPYLCSLQGEEEKSFLCQHLCEMASQQLSNKEETNLITFIDLLLKASPNYPYKIQNLLDAKELLECYVFKFLSGSLENIGVPFLIRALKIMNSILDNTESSKQIWDTAQTPFPVTFCICSIVNSCSVLWQGDDLDAHRPYLKECALEVSDKLMNLYAKDTLITEKKGIVWLYNKLLVLDWRMLAYIQPLFKSSTTHLQMVLPESSSRIFRQDPNIKYVNHPDYVDNPLLVLFEFVKTTDKCVELVKEMLVKEVVFRDKDLYVKTAIVLAKVLPHCVKEEWNRICSVLEFFVNEENFHQSGTQEKVTLELSQCVRRKLLLKNVLKKTLHVINSKYCLQSDNTAMWLHIMKGYSQNLKGVVDLPNNINPMEKMHLCHGLVLDMLAMMISLPASCSESLFVLALDFLNEFMVSQDKFKKSHEEEISTERMDLLSNWEETITQHLYQCPYEEYKETLLKKFNKDEKKEC